MTVGSGRALGSRYQLTDRLGEGAMGEVWRAQDRASGTFRAAKLLKGSFASDRDIVARFVQERSILVTLDHPNIVKVHDLVVEGDDLAIVMDLVEGPDLRSRLRSSGTLSVRDAVTVVAAVLDALQAAHSRGCLHRDVKPDNVLLAQADPIRTEDVLLTDFSIARLAQDSTVQMTGLLGTPGYMPPELFTEGRFSAASDLYATGILLYELLAGRTPFAGAGTAHTVGFRHVQVAPPPIPVPPQLWQLIATMLAKDPTLRLGVVATAEALRALPDEVMDFPALPLQPVPDAWETALPTSVAGAPIRLEVLDAGVDVGATNLHSGSTEPSQVQARTGQVQAFSPRADSLVGETQLGVVREGSIAPVLTPEITSAPEAPRRRWPWVVGSLVAAGAVVGGLFAFGVLGGSDDSPGDTPSQQAAAQGGPTTVEADNEDGTYDSGLTVRREATWDAATSTAEVTFTVEAEKVALKGPVLQVFPLPEGSDLCPGVSFTEGDGSSVPAADAGGARCAWELQADPDERGEVELRASVPLELAGDDQQAALTDWLDQVGSLTQDALEGIRSGSDYAAQRLTGLRVEPYGGGRFRIDDEVTYVVLPEWSSGVEGNDPIYTSGISQGTNPVITQVAGADGIQTDASCDQLGSEGLRLYAKKFGTCTIVVRLGQVEGEADVDVIGGDN